MNLCDISVSTVVTSVAIDEPQSLAQLPKNLRDLFTLKFLQFARKSVSSAKLFVQVFYVA